MALANYTDLQNTIKSYLINDDVAAQVTDFIRLAESRINREIRIRQMQKTTGALSITADTSALPTDYLEKAAMRRVLPSLANFTFYDEDKFFDLPDRGGTPDSYTLLNDTIYWYPYPGVLDPGVCTYELWYYAKTAPLTVVNTTNWLLTTYPDLYLYASLLEAQPFLIDDTRLAVWEQVYARSKNSVQSLHSRGRRRPRGGATTSSVNMERR